MQLVALFQRNLYEQLHVGQLSQQDAHQTVGQMCVDSQSVSCEGLQARGKMFADTAHEQEDECVAIAAAQFIADTFESVCQQALVGIAELCSQQTDAP